MTAHKTEGPDVVDDQAESLNEVHLRGRLAATPVLRELSSGDSVWQLRVAVDRPAPTGKDKPSQRMDSLECVVWSGRLRTQVRSWSEGDVVQVTGALRHRFFHAGGATVSRVEVELSQGRIIRRAGSG